MSQRRCPSNQSVGVLDNQRSLSGTPRVDGHSRDLSRRRCGRPLLPSLKQLSQTESGELSRKESGAQLGKSQAHKRRTHAQNEVHLISAARSSTRSGATDSQRHHKMSWSFLLDTPTDCGGWLARKDSNLRSPDPEISDPNRARGPLCAQTDGPHRLIWGVSGEHSWESLTNSPDPQRIRRTR
jgi:hypothetical protein